MNFSYYLASLAFFMNILIGINPKICEEELIFWTSLLINGHHTNIIKAIAIIIIIMQSPILRFWNFTTWRLIFWYSFYMKNNCTPYKYFCIFKIEENFLPFIIFSGVWSFCVKLYKISVKAIKAGLSPC